MQKVERDSSQPCAFAAKKSRIRTVLASELHASTWTVRRKSSKYQIGMQEVVELCSKYKRDFMSGPSNAPRLSMPEPHEVLGVIKGVIIRDAQGNIGLSQYQFNTM